MSRLIGALGQGMAIRESNAGRSTADVLIAVAFGYFVMCFTLSWLGLRLERRTSRELRAGTAAGVRWRPHPGAPAPAGTPNRAPGGIPNGTMGLS
jgi:hypothetical protein